MPAHVPLDKFQETRENGFSIAHVPAERGEPVSMSSWIGLNIVVGHHTFSSVRNGA